MMSSEKWQVVYYLSPQGKNPIKEFLDSLGAKQQVKILRLFQLIAEYGLSAVGSHLKKLSGTPFWEMRILGQDNLRIIYVVVLKNTVLALHGFSKKSQKTPPKEISVVFSRYQDWLLRNKVHS